MTAPSSARLFFYETICLVPQTIHASKRNIRHNILLIMSLYSIISEIFHWNVLSHIVCILTEVCSLAPLHVCDVYYSNDQKVNHDACLKKQCQHFSVINELVFSIGWIRLCSTRGILTMRLSSLRVVTKSRDIWFTWRKPQRLFLTVQQHDLILGYSPSGKFFFPQHTVLLNGMKLNMLACNCTNIQSVSDKKKYTLLVRHRINAGVKSLSHTK